jgi:hypothetical protein
MDISCARTCCEGAGLTISRMAGVTSGVSTNLYTGSVLTRWQTSGWRRGWDGKVLPRADSVHADAFLREVQRIRLCQARYRFNLVNPAVIPMTHSRSGIHTMLGHGVKSILRDGKKTENGTNVDDRATSWRSSCTAWSKYDC